MRTLALSPGYYAPNSALSQGRWARVLVKETGMQFISNSTLKTLGFSNPEAVNVYGYGGRILPERLYDGMPDDLPPVVSMRTPTGIIFFGHSTQTWTHSPSSGMMYVHTAQPYSENSYYFISDNEMTRPEATPRGDIDASGEPLTLFTERLLHEQDIIAPSTTGRVILGEDFRTQPTRTFNFSLPGIVGDAKMRVTFGAKVTSGNSSLLFTSNGEQLAATESDKIPGVSGETFLSYRTTTKTLPAPGERLNLGIKYTYSGAIFTAALDYIEIEYQRALALSNGELYFYLSPAVASKVELAGCNESTVIWDVTDPLKPQTVAGTLSGGDLTFTTPAGYREYVAFNPQKVSRTATGAGKITNQDLHGMKAPGMLIISPDQFLTQASKIADLHAATDGLEVAVVTPQQVYNEFSSGTPDVTAFRKLLKMWYDRAADNGGDYTRYCLLMSRPTYDHKMVTTAVKRAGYPRVPIWQSEGSYTEGGSYSTDDYIGMLADNPGVLNMNNAMIHVAVGRMPVKSVAEAESAVAKLEKYLTSPNPGSWRNNVMLIADDQDSGVHLDQAEKVINKMRASDNGADYIYEKLYLDSYPLRYSGSGPVYPEAKQRMFDKINEGVALIDYIGHASPRGWGHESLLTWTELTSMTNRNLPFIYAATCEFMYWDADDVSGAEEMWLNPDAGVIGMICPSRKVYITNNGKLNENTGTSFFSRGEDGLPLRLGDIMIKGKNATTNDNNKLRYAFMGDPSMRLPGPTLKVTVDELNGVALPSAEWPELKAGSRVSLSGRVVNSDGLTAEDFNGTVTLQLYDAERVIDTYGNGDDGEVMTYNDRKTRLYIGQAKAEGGIWKSEFVMPAEIENNYSPALLSLYASDADGREANGSTEQLYVYGSIDTPTDDEEGPKISDFYLNSPSFASGSVTSPAPMLYATLNDPSGINLSESGIGHKMSVSVDGKKWYNDVALYYTPDPESFESGKLVYPLQGVEPGEHTLTLTVFDNANNSSAATLTFTVKADWAPTISHLTTDVNPASTGVVFTVEVDGAVGTMPCQVEVFDLGGKLVWSSEGANLTTGSTSVSQRWDLRDTNGHRVSRGIYLYRATVKGSDGREIVKSNKLAVTN